MRKEKVKEGFITKSLTLKPSLALQESGFDLGLRFPVPKWRFSKLKPSGSTTTHGLLLPMPRGKTSVRKDPTGQRVLLISGQNPRWNRKGFQVYSKQVSISRSLRSSSFRLHLTTIGFWWSQISTKASFSFWLDDVTRQAQIFSNFEGSSDLVSSCQTWYAEAKHDLRQHPSAKRCAL